jgi:hypothetical protein
MHQRKDETARACLYGGLWARGRPPLFLEKRIRFVWLRLRYGSGYGWLRFWSGNDAQCRSFGYVLRYDTVVTYGLGVSIGHPKAVTQNP